MLFQDCQSSLLPWRTALENVRLAVPNAIRGKQARIQSALQALLEVELEYDNHQKFPHQLSGGQLQRLALARALAHSPEVLLLDEPLSSLDDYARHALEDLLVQVATKNQLTIMFVTHNAEEAARVSHRVIILSSSPGQVKASLQRPCSLAVSPESRVSSDFRDWWRTILSQMR